MIKLIVTGANGFIGKQVISVLKDHEHEFEIHGLTTRNITDVSDGVTWHTVDLLDHTRTANTVKKIEATHLLHLAWYSDHATRWESLQNIEWMKASINLVEEFSNCTGERIVTAGSCAEYDWKYGYCKENFTPTNPSSMYGECKLSVNRLADKLTEMEGVSYASGRIFFVYGPHENKNRLTAHVIKSLLHNQQANCSHGHQIRDYMHVTDVADALVTLLISEYLGPINIASGRPIKLREMVDLIGQKLNKKHLIRYAEFDESENYTPAIIADVSKMYEDLSWQPSIGLDEGIDKTINWWKTNL